MFRHLTSCLMTLALTILGALTSRADTYPKREVRAVWVSTAYRIDFPTNYGTTAAKAKAMKAEITTMLDKFKAAGINAVYFQVRPMADRFYSKTSYTNAAGTTYTVEEPISVYLTDSRGTDFDSGVSFDPLNYFITQAHNRGIELHAWINPYRWLIASGDKTDATYGSKYTPSTYSSTFDKSYRDLMIGYYNSSSNLTYFILNPALAKARSKIYNVCRVLTGNYDIDGIVFDDYFYPEGMGNMTSTTAEDYADYQSYVSGLADGETAKSIAAWRRQNINTMIKKANTEIKAIKPYVKFGISPAGASGTGLKSSDGIPPLSDYCSASDWQYASLASDPMAWMRGQWIDYISPQLYWKMGHSTNGFGKMAQWWAIVAKTFGRHFYASHSISFLYSTTTTANTEENWSEINDQIIANREATQDGNFGSVFFSARDMDGTRLSGLDTYLASNAFSKPAITPAMTWLGLEDPGTVTGLALSGAKLTWDAMDDATMRYIIYKVPAEVELDDARSTEGGLRAEYIAGVSYTNSYSFDSEISMDDYWVAVAPYDRAGNEWTLSGLNINQGTPTLATPSLYIPKNGETTDSDISFVASLVDAEATTTLEISRYEDFSALYFSGSARWETATDPTTNTEWLQYTLPIQTLPNGTYYWRVRVTRSGYKSSVSQVRQLIIGDGVYTGSTSYTAAREDNEYPFMTTASQQMTFTNMWVREEGSNALTDLDAALCRDMVARAASDQLKNDMIYITKRESSASTHKLARFDARTGEQLDDLTLTFDDNYVTSYFAINGVLTDSENQLLVHNMCLASGTFNMAVVDPLTGAATTIFKVSTAARFDHADIVGALKSGGTYTVFTASGTDNCVYRYKVVDGEVTASESMKLSALGSAARVHAIDENYFYVDGPSIQPQYYKFKASTTAATATATLSISSTSATQYNRPCGLTTFFHNGVSYLVCCTSSSDNSNSWQWTLYSADDFTSSSSPMGGKTALWSFPENGIGTNTQTSGDYGAPISVIQRTSANMAPAKSATNVNGTSTTIYAYSPGNGLAAYSLTRQITTGVNDIDNSGDISVHVSGSMLTFSQEVDTYAVYNIMGVCVARGENTRATDINVQRGVYIIEYIKNNITIRHSFYIE